MPTIRSTGAKALSSARSKPQAISSRATACSRRRSSRLWGKVPGLNALLRI